MANEARPTCKTCRFWEWDKTYEFELHQCLRHAPKDDGGYSGCWPKTTADKWCGEHEPRTLNKKWDAERTEQP